MNKRTLVINPGSSTTKFAVYEGTGTLFSRSIEHTAEELAPFEAITDQFEFRTNLILSVLREEGIDPAGFDAVIGRGGLLKPICGGVWAVNKLMLQDLRIGVSGQHACNLGGIMAFEMAKKSKAPAFIADPVVVDEMCDEARISGHPELPRRSIFHALNQKATARRAAGEMGKKYEECRLIVAHIGGGISVGSHVEGRVIDVNNALNGEGPFSTERSGGLPVGQLVDLCFSGTKTKQEIQKMIKGGGGFQAYLGTSNGKEVANRAAAGDAKADLLFRTLAYQVAKEIGAHATVLEGRIDGIVLTGGLANDKWLMEILHKRISFLGRIFIYPGEDELEALRDAGLRALTGESEVQQYQ